MCKDDIKLLGKKEKELETVIQVVRIYRKENEMHKILQTDHLIPARRPDISLINQK